ncbi:hypothetical protein, partial [Erythrobacter sp. HI0019]|uniref:hypothetical protein n=1 Tax=Erythrobacter sp. HI0019 TaxID=1822222 RepID=UPI001F2EB62E
VASGKAEAHGGGGSDERCFIELHVNSPFVVPAAFSKCGKNVMNGLLFLRFPAVKQERRGWRFAVSDTKWPGERPGRQPYARRQSIPSAFVPDDRAM